MLPNLHGLLITFVPQEIKILFPFVMTAIGEAHSLLILFKKWHSSSILLFFSFLHDASQIDGYFLYELVFSLPDQLMTLVLKE